MCNEAHRNCLREVNEAFQGSKSPMELRSLIMQARRKAGEVYGWSEKELQETTRRAYPVLWNQIPDDAEEVAVSDPGDEQESITVEPQLI